MFRSKVSNRLILFCLLLFVIDLKEIKSAKILCAFPTVSRSHFIVAQTIMMELAKKGHDVTVISEFRLDKPLKNYRHIYIELSDMHDKMVEQFVEHSGDKMFVIKQIPFVMEFGYTEMRNAMNHPETRRIMKEEHFDLVVLEGGLGDPLLGLAAHFKCPAVMITTNQPLIMLQRFMGNPVELSYVPSQFLGYTSNMMTFKQRVKNFLIGGLELSFPFLLNTRHEAFYRSFFPESDYPSLAELRQNISLVLINTHFSQGVVRPNIPAMVEVGGIQIKETPNPLPDDLQKFMDDSKHGVIYFSFGSNVKSSYLSKEKLSAILNTFRKLKENVLWKFEQTSMDGLPKNVKVSKWFPQDELLAHPNLKLFVTHGGIGSVLEAKHFGVPLVIIPIYGDQMGNADSVVSEGWGVSIKFVDLKETTLTDSINTVLNNPKYTQRAQHLSILFRDRPLSPMQTSIYWIEYVMRHNGARHMQANSRYMNFIQLHSIDVISFLSVILFLVIFINIKIFTFFIRLCKSKKNKTKNE